MAYVINDECLNCAFCHNRCPKDAIFFNGYHYEIDQRRCVRCGTCAKICNIRAVEDTECPAPIPEPHEKRYIDCDLLCIGGGTSGLITAARVAELTQKRVVVLESRENTGGTGAYALGIRVFDSKWERDAGEPLRIDDYIRGAMNNTFWKLDPQLVAAAFRALPRFFDWLCQWAPAEDIWHLSDGAANNPTVGAVNLGGRRTVDIRDVDHKAGPFIAEHMRRRCEELGVVILTQHTAREFMVDDGGRLCGVLADDPGGETEVTFRACLSATGGLMRSELLTRVFPEFKDAVYPNYAHAYQTNTGAGPLMAERVGIPLDLDNIAVAPVNAMPLPFDEEMSLQGQRCDALRVNLDGRRWINETVNDVTHFIRLKEQPRMVSYTIMDSETLSAPKMGPPPYLVDPMADKNILACLPSRVGGEPAKPIEFLNGIPHFAVTRGEKTPATPEGMRRLAELPGKHVVVADTIQEMAELIGIDPDTLTDTVTRYNELCDRGHDDDFFKPADYLRPIRTPPFIAVCSMLYSDGAFGGFYINAEMQVTDGCNPVPGLWAAGDNTSGRFLMAQGERHEIINDYSWAVASAFVAADSIADYLKGRQ